jgi:hypothetical protein
MEASMNVAAQSRRIGASARLFHRSSPTKYYQTWLVANCQYSTGEELYTFSWLCCLLFVYINL